MSSQRRRPVRCPWCEEAIATWRADWRQGSGEYAWPEPGYLCDACGWAANAETADGLELKVADGRIRSPQDVAPRIEGARARAAEDSRLSELDRAAHGVYCDVAIANTSVEIMAADGWVAEQVGATLGRTVARQHVARSRNRLERLGYVRKLGVKDVTRFGLRAAVETRSARGLRPATLLEVRRAPPVPLCEICLAEIPDGLRVWRRYCSDRCRQAAHRA
ncbi:MAG TPA: hypothetical protein VH306_10050 [Gaiellaceae bacterium]|jgi:hypothetical protein